MQFKAVCAIALASFLFGCSKGPPVADVAADVAPAPLPAKSPPEVAAGIQDISQKVNAQNYEAAVGGLAAMKGMPMSDKDKQAYERELQRTLDALSQKAAEGDVRAQESYRMLGRFMTGR